MQGRIGAAVLTLVLVLVGAAGASAKPLRFGRCVLKPHARLLVRTPQVIVTSAPHTEIVDAEPVTNPTYFTCLRRTGEHHQLFAASSDPSPDAGYQNSVAALRAAGHYVLYLATFVQNNPEGPAAVSAEFRVVDVADHDRQTIATPDPNFALAGVGEMAISLDGYIAWTQVTPEGLGTGQTVEADTGRGPVTLATAAIPDTLLSLAFHKLAFHGETLTWQYKGTPQSAQLTTPPGTTRAMGSLDNGPGSALKYSVLTNVTADAFELSLPQGDSISATSTPAGFSCTDTGNAEECENGSVQPNTPVTGSFDHTGTVLASCGCVQVAFSSDDGASWFATAVLIGPPYDSPPPPSLTLSCPSTVTAGEVFGVSGRLIGPSAAVVTITYSRAGGPSLTHSAQTDSLDYYGDSVSLTKRGTWTVQASYAGDSQYPSLQSPVCTTSVE